jgi:antirestriction protein ArdC
VRSAGHLAKPTRRPREVSQQLVASVLKDDPKAIFKAAAAAEKAVRFIEDLQPQSQSQEEAA